MIPFTCQDGSEDGIGVNAWLLLVISTGLMSPDWTRTGMLLGWPHKLNSIGINLKPFEQAVSLE